MAHSNQVPWGEINKGTIHKGVNRLHKKRGVSAVAAAKSKALFSFLSLEGWQKAGEKQRRGGRKGVTEEGKEEAER